MGGLVQHGLAPGEVRSIFKKDFGISQTPLKNIWVVGTFPKAFAKYITSTSAWGFTNTNTVTGLVGNINTIKYSALTFATDLMFLGGNFVWTLGGVTCTNLCQFNYQTETINQIVSATWASEIYRISISGIQLISTGTVFIGGGYSFTTGSNTYNNLATVTSSNWATAGGTIAQLSTNTTVLTSLIRAQWTCSSVVFTLDCSAGSTAIGGDNGYLFYYNVASSAWQTFGGGPLGSVYAIDSTVAGAGSLSLSIFLIISLIVYFLF